MNIVNFPFRDGKLFFQLGKKNELGIALTSCIHIARASTINSNKIKEQGINQSKL